METSDLIKEAKQGSAAAQKCLFDLLSERLLFVCRRYVKNSEDAEELLLDGFYKFFTKLSSFNYQGDAALYVWLKNDQNKLHSYRNDFVMLTYGQGGTRDHDPRKDFAYSAVFSLGYLINRNGDYFDKNTFRLGAGKIQFYKTNIEPVVYFNNFFKAVTPGIRISQYF